MLDPQTEAKAPEALRSPSAHRNWAMAAWVAGVFTVLVGVTMVFSFLSIRAQDPWKSPKLAELKEKLRANPADEQIKQGVRQLDLQLRQRYFRQLSRLDSGVYMLLGGVALFVLAGKQAARSQRRLPMPQPKHDAGEQSVRSATRARWSVAASGTVIGGVLFILTLSLNTALPSGCQGWRKQQAQATRPVPRNRIPPSRPPLAMPPRLRNSCGTGPVSVGRAAAAYRP